VSDPHSPPPFDGYAAHYDRALEQGISVSGEDKEYFARGRTAWLARRLRERGADSAAVMDFGCGTGSATPYLFDALGAARLVGVDPSRESLAEARKAWDDRGAAFVPLNEFAPDGDFDVVYCNGVFHHIPPEERRGAVRTIFDSLRPGGLFALWENNPWNPGARLVMSRIPFDRDAVPLSAPEARRMVREGGFEVVGTDFLFIFPRCLGVFRFLEPALSRFPLGAQYQVLCRKTDEEVAS
jgi:SAM-dependent methyltransferase